MYLINLHNHLFMYLPNKLIILLQNPNIPKMHFLIKSILFFNILNIYTFFIKFHTFDEGGSKKHSMSKMASLFQTLRLLGSKYWNYAPVF